MKVYLLPPCGSFYKANLHSHSTLSDGNWTPEEMKRNYMAEGYSILAYTDHQVLICHNDLAEENFLPLNGYELDIPENDKPWGVSAKTCHLCLIALDKERTKQNIYHESVFIDRNAEMTDIAEDRAPIERKYDPEFISNLIKEAREDGFFVTYNHPVWSLESDGQYLKYHGMHAVEIVNYSSCVLGHDDRNSNLYDNILHNDEEIFCVGADDNHNKYPIDSPLCDSFGGFTMIKAEKLEYSAVADALIKGHFYASEGPEIYELYYDTDDKLFHIKTSEAAYIIRTSGERYSTCFAAEKKGETVNEATFDFGRSLEGYVRFIVRDREGKEAHTHSYKISEILSKNGENDVIY
ncbi:MAG: PHP domain-containing protein [Ruminococcaceae bacterium]|nr:PHP domain-containing protein [Oscillospiraceae bacterium]